MTRMFGFPAVVWAAAGLRGRQGCASDNHQEPASWFCLELSHIAIYSYRVISALGPQQRKKAGQFLQIPADALLCQ